MRSVITGASSGIGKAIAAALASEGGSVCLVGRDQARLEATAEISRRTARRVMTHTADLSVGSAVAALTERVRREFSGLDALVHCAGIHSTGSLERTSVQELDKLYLTNFRMPFVLTQSLLPLLKPEQGQIVFVNSSQGLQAKANTGLFAATQHALKAMADSLRDEVNADGMRVLSIFPGRTATPRMKALYEAEQRPYEPDLLLQPEDIAQVVLDALKLPRTAEITNLQIRPRIKSY